MAIFRCTFRSTMLMNDTNLNIIMPDKRLRRPKVLYLLHGYQQHFGSWLNQSSLARYVNGKNIAVIMPDGGRSFYSDMVMTGEHYYSYITRELPVFLRSQFNIEPTREETAVAGLSMGGYGALKIGMSNPDKFSLIGAFSPACDIIKIVNEHPALATAICGNTDVEGGKHDLYALAKDMCGKEQPRPEILHFCGSNDFMIDENRTFRDFMQTLPVNYSYHEEPGTHDWPLWDKWIAEFIERLI